VGNSAGAENEQVSRSGTISVASFRHAAASKQLVDAFWVVPAVRSRKFASGVSRTEL
jgi:hypothetical protein